MNHSRAVATLIGFLFWAGVACVSAAGADAGDSLARSLSAALAPGTTHSEVTQAVARLRPGEGWGDSTSLGRHQALSRYDLGDGVCLLAEYKNVSNELGNLGPVDKLDSAQVVRFEDLRGHIPNDLFPAMRLAHLSSSVSGFDFDPVALVRAANGLHPMGKKRILKALRAYEALATEDWDQRFRYGMDEQRIFLILRVLFVRSDGEAEMPWMTIGSTSPDVQPGDKDWPLFPLAMENDIPFCLSSGYNLGGKAELPSAHLDYCEKHCTLRQAPLRPTASPLAAVNAICNSRRWHRLFSNSEDAAHTQYLLRLQALRCLAGITGKMPDQREFCPGCVSKKEADSVWAGYRGDHRLADVSWDIRGQQFGPGRAMP